MNLQKELRHRVGSDRAACQSKLRGEQRFFLTSFLSVQDE